MKKKLQKPYWEMNTAELREATREFDEPFVFEKARPLSAEERRLLRRAAKRGAGRPKIGKGSRKIHITLEKDLLKRADASAERLKIGRSELIARGIRMFIAG